MQEKFRGSSQKESTKKQSEAAGSPVYTPTLQVDSGEMGRKEAGRQPQGPARRGQRQ